MKRARAFDPDTGEFVGFKRASALTEASRYAFQYKCCEEGCNCSVHWRKTVHAKENTDIRLATFVKNPSSPHNEGCHQDYERIAREHSSYTYFKDGAFHVRVNFPLGAAKVDLNPMRGYLKDEQIAAANNKKNITPFSSLTDLTAFVEKVLGPLDSEDLPDLTLHYQGRTASFADKVIGNLNYKKLYEVSVDYHKGDVTPVAMTIVKPDHEISPNDKGKRRFVCTAQEAIVEGRKHAVKPVIVCFNEDESVADTIENAMIKGETLSVITRPFSNGYRFRTAVTQVYLNVRKPEQVAAIADSYWRVIEPPQLRMNFDTPQGPQIFP